MLQFMAEHLFACFTRAGLSALLNRFQDTPPRYTSSHFRGHFTDQPFHAFRPLRNHTHGESAALRSSSVQFCDDFVRFLQLVPYHVQCSSTDQRKGRQGSREYYFAKDTGIEPRTDSNPDDSVRILTDVDYYVDMPRELTRSRRPTLLYTFVPENAAETLGETSYRFEYDNTVTVSVSGGATYSHKLWDYGEDTFVTGNWWRYVVYSVERRCVGPNRQVLCLYPTASWKGPLSWLARTLLPGKSLKRFEPVRNGYVRFSRHTPDGLVVTTGRPGTYQSITVPASADAHCEATASMLKKTTTLSVAHVAHAVGPEIQDTDCLAVLVSFHSERIKDVGPCIYTPATSIVRYQPANTPLFDEGKPVITPFMLPLLGPAYCILKNASTERKTIEARLEQVKSEVTTLPPATAAWATEFINLMFPLGPMLHPYDDNEVSDRLHRPSQRALISAAAPFSLIHDRRVDGMIKSEANAAPNDPRLISIMDPADKVEHSKVMYALTDYMKQFPWYAFGITPREIADRVVTIAAKARRLSGHDCSRMDGRVSLAVRAFERQLLIRAFLPAHVARVLESAKNQYDLKGGLPCGTKYCTGCSRCSGSAETSVFNTVLNACMAYCALRMAGYSKHQAWALLGIYGGDDGVTPDVPGEVLSCVGSHFGQKIVSVIFERGQRVVFLARIYSPSVWWGVPDSCCDLPRQLIKFHVTKITSETVKPETKLVQKAESFMLTDRNTPIIGPLVRLVAELKGSCKNLSLTEIARWGDQWDGEDQYPNDNDGEWMNAYCNEVLPGFNHVKFAKALAGVRNLKDLLVLETCHAPVEPPEGKPGYVCEPLDDARKHYSAGTTVAPVALSSLNAHGARPRRKETVLKVRSRKALPSARELARACDRTLPPPIPQKDFAEIVRRTEELTGLKAPPKGTKATDLPEDHPSRIFLRALGRERKAFLAERDAK